ncbi:MAG: glycosyltransferase family 2 protein [Ginsengibacter sp.]
MINYNVKFFLEQCLCSVIKAVQNIEAEIFVVDNNSSDDSKVFFKEKFKTVKFLWNEKNYGFAKANNRALSLATGKYILFLNPDTIIPEDCFTKCISFFESHAGAGALGIQMIDGSGKFLRESKRSFPSPLTSLYKLSGLTKLFPGSKTFAKYYLGNLDQKQNNEVDVLAGAFIMTQGEIIKSLNGFDESFFMYGEDIDLSFRIQKAGYKNFYFAETTIIHFKGESTKKGSLNYVRIFYKAMSTFVKKHYGGGKADIFNFFMQSAILFRAFASAIRRFIRWIGVPVLDAAVILFSFWFVKLLWNTYVKQEVDYSSNMLIIAFPVFTLVFLGASYFSGLYDNGYKQSRLNRSAIAAIVVLLAGYSLLPESLRFSRGILIFGSITAYILITLLRQLLLSLKVLESDKSNRHRQTIVVGTPGEYARAHEIMQHCGMEENILGRVIVNGESETNAIGNIGQIMQLVNMYPVKEIILCEGKLSFKKLIELVKVMPRHVRIMFHSSCSESIIGSEGKDIAGRYVAPRSNFKLASVVDKRNKQLSDLIIALIFIISFPVHLLLKKKPGLFFKNVSDVFLQRKTWVGYATTLKELPSLKPGVLSVTGIPDFMNTLPQESLTSADIWYAANYTVWHDIHLVWKNYKFLSA